MLKIPGHTVKFFDRGGKVFQDMWTSFQAGVVQILEDGVKFFRRCGEFSRI